MNNLVYVGEEKKGGGAWAVNSVIVYVPYLNHNQAIYCMLNVSLTVSILLYFCICLLINSLGYHCLYIWWFTESKWSCSFKRSIYYMTFDFYMLVFLDQYETLSSPGQGYFPFAVQNGTVWWNIWCISNQFKLHIYPLNEFSAKGQFHNCVTWVIVLNYQEQCWGEESVAN